MADRSNSKIVRTVERRPAETAAGLALAGTVYGFLTQAGVDQVIAAIVAVIVAFGPGAVSAVVDRLESPGP